MKYLTMFFASLRMVKAPDSGHFAHDLERWTTRIDELCPEDTAGRFTAEDSYEETRTVTVPKAA